MSEKMDNNTTKEDDNMLAVAVNQNANKQMLLHDLKDSLVELNKKRENNSHVQAGRQSSWRDLFDEED